MSTYSLSPSKFMRSRMGAEQIVRMYRERRNNMGADLDRMRKIQAVMNDEMWLPLPELSAEERPAVANLASQGLRQLAQRIASVEPVCYFPSTNPGAKSADERSRNRGRVIKGWHWDNKLRLQTAQQARHFLAYANSAVVIKPDRKRGIPRWYTRHPLRTFPSDAAFEDCAPVNCIFTFTRDYAWLLEHYENAARRIRKPLGWDDDDPDYGCEFELLEYVDANECSVILAGHHNAGESYPTDEVVEAEAIELYSEPNLAGVCPAVVPGAINLDKQLGHFDGIIGMYQAQAALMAITLVAQRRAVWRREWVESYQGQEATITQSPDPQIGQPGKINGGTIQTQDIDPSLRGLELMDRLAENMRMTAGLPSEFGGMAATNVRTGRRGAQVMGAAIDFTISEAQDVFGSARYEENVRAIEVDKAYFNRRKTYYICTRSFAGKVQYKPEELWETNAHVVKYPIAGTDMQNLPIEGGQRVMMGTLSRRSFMDMDPAVDDPDAEEQRMIREQLREASLNMVKTIAATPDTPFQMTDMMRLDELVANGDSIYEAFDKVQREAQARQAQQAPAPTEPATPEQQPGVNMPGMGTEEPGPEVNDTSLAGFTGLLQQLGSSQQAMKYRRNNG